MLTKHPVFRLNTIITLNLKTPFGTPFIATYRKCTELYGGKLFQQTTNKISKFNSGQMFKNIVTEFVLQKNDYIIINDLLIYSMNKTHNKCYLANCLFVQ